MSFQHPIIGQEAICPDALRQTGRTTRMLKDAVEQARQGRKVYVVAADHAEKQRLEDLLGEGSGISVETPSSPGNFDWLSMSLIGAHPNCVVLADHFAIEKHFRRVLEMLHKYDVE